jgi:acyl carrier protein
LDRAALPAPDQASLITRAYEAPQGEAEQVLAGIWQALLGVEQVGRHDHFFEMGGNSLLLIRVGFCIYEQFGVKMNVGQIYEIATLKEMAAAVETAQGRAYSDREEATIVTLDI